MYGPKKSLVFLYYKIRELLYYQLLHNSFSQHGEDLVIDALLGNKDHGFYVDIGAHDPHLFSNTKRFYRKGWRGINIEPDAHLIEKFKASRPDDINLNIGISNIPGTLTFYRMFPATLSTFSEEAVKSYLDQGYELVEKLPVPVKPLRTVLQTYVKNAEIDFMSIDTEGFESHVLASNDWQKFRPTVICIESENPRGSEVGPITQKLLALGYVKHLDNGINSIFVVRNHA